MHLTGFYVRILRNVISSSQQRLLLSNVMEESILLHLKLLSICFVSSFFPYLKDGCNGVEEFLKIQLSDDNSFFT